MSSSFTTLLGLAAAGLTTAAYSPQVWKALRTQQTDDLSLAMTITLASGLALWIVYGIFQAEAVIIVANSSAFVLSGTLMILKLRYR